MVYGEERKEEERPRTGPPVNRRLPTKNGLREVLEGDGDASCR